MSAKEGEESVHAEACAFLSLFCCWQLELKSSAAGVANQNAKIQFD
ncbi:hypothetical protein [Paenibacillus radicis (ex Gao et al. 2016)]|uniref:Uncharacterized protein n=1 Tax=Paenibacillus radicis (ex Gao et al. 2016) TaxID=1737354 RepID=A0A917GYW3_9BACL|nr:hypothetical protein [Paenibacillus radicis (ex Gao et al. 2016)]GGG61866.1 hypothetical protein GCM10010918_14330 [Paenibacillus radicis (ex Gao et al. 2016)]